MKSLSQIIWYMYMYTGIFNSIVLDIYPKQHMNSVCFHYYISLFIPNTNELLCDKTNNLSFQPGLTQTSLHSLRSRMEARNFRFKKKSNSTKSICVANTKMLISCAVAAQLICIFVFPYAYYCFSHATAQIL